MGVFFCESRGAPYNPFRTEKHVPHNNSKYFVPNIVGPVIKELTQNRWKKTIWLIDWFRCFNIFALFTQGLGLFVGKSPCFYPKISFWVGYRAPRLDILRKKLMPSLPLCVPPPPPPCFRRSTSRKTHHSRVCACYLDHQTAVCSRPPKILTDGRKGIYVVYEIVLDRDKARSVVCRTFDVMEVRVLFRWCLGL